MKTILHAMHWRDLSHEIRVLPHQAFNNPDVSNGICLLQNRLISPPWGYLRKSLESWIMDLRITLQEIQHESEKLKCDDRIADLFNQSAIVFMELEHFKYAREICYSQIQLFIRWSVKSSLSHLLKFVFQPWMHLIQINRLEGNKYDAFNQLNILDFTCSDQFIFDENRKLKEKLYYSLSQDGLLHHLIITRSLLERIQLNLESHQYAELIDFIENKKNRFTLRQEFIIQEALAIAYANLGNAQKALMILTQGHLHKNQSENLILKLRQLEICLVSGLMDQSIGLAYDCLDAAVEVDDEVLKAESLIILFRCVKDEKAKKKIKQLMITHYRHTQYASIKRKMLHYFNDLKTIKTRHYSAEITSLFEDLLAFDVI